MSSHSKTRRANKLSSIELPTEQFLFYRKRSLRHEPLKWFKQRRTLRKILRSSNV